MKRSIFSHVLTILVVVWLAALGVAGVLYPERTQTLFERAMAAESEGGPAAETRLGKPQQLRGADRLHEQVSKAGLGKLVLGRRGAASRRCNIPRTGTWSVPLSRRLCQPPDDRPLTQGRLQPSNAGLRSPVPALYQPAREKSYKVSATI